MAKVLRNSGKARLVGLGLVTFTLVGCVGESGAAELDGAELRTGSIGEVDLSPAFDGALPLREDFFFAPDDVMGWPDDWWFHSEGIDLLELLETDPLTIDEFPGLIAEFDEDFWREHGWTGNGIPYEMDQMVDYFANTRLDPNPANWIEPVWRREHQIVELWVDPDLDPAIVHQVVTAHSVELDQVVVRHRQFAMADLQAAQSEIWAQGVNGISVNMSSVRYDGTGIDVGLSEPFDGSTDEPLVWISGIPIYPSFGVMNLIPFPRVVPGSINQ